ncbi:hypothetical protein Goklo_023626, partial [Gossypium klotzschianum]|nr:hypothetical protein [Gossypium klotzschianum]
MRLFCWNCRGLENPTIVCELKQLLVSTNSNVIFLYETKLHSNSLQRIHNICRMEGCLAVSSEGRREDDNKKLRFTGFYGHVHPNLRKRSWDILRRVGGAIREGW